MLTTRYRLRGDTAGDWAGLAYRLVFYTLATSPLWGTLFALAILWQRAPF